MEFGTPAFQRVQKRWIPTTDVTVAVSQIFSFKTENREEKNGFTVANAQKNCIQVRF